MADTYRKLMDRAVGPGGVNCFCCNRYHGSDKMRLNKLTRTRLKAKDNVKYRDYLNRIKE